MFSALSTDLQFWSVDIVQVLLAQIVSLVFVCFLGFWLFSLLLIAPVTLPLTSKISSILIQLVQWLLIEPVMCEEKGRVACPPYLFTSPLFSLLHSLSRFTLSPFPVLKLTTFTLDGWLEGYSLLLLIDWVSMKTPLVAISECNLIAMPVLYPFISKTSSPIASYCGPYQSTV